MSPRLHHWFIGKDKIGALILVAGNVSLAFGDFLLTTNLKSNPY